MPEQTTKSIRCYLIDDDKIFNLISSKIIEKSGWLVDLIVFTNASEALAKLESDKANPEKIPSMILLDVRMPDMDGFEFLEELQKMEPALLRRIRVYMLTSSLDDRDMEKSLAFPIVRKFFNKPLSIQDLETILMDQRD